MSKKTTYPPVTTRVCIPVFAAKRLPVRAAGYALISQLRAHNGKIIETFATTTKITIGATKKQIEYEAVLAFLKRNDDTLPDCFRIKSATLLRVLNGLGQLSDRRFNSRGGQPVAYAHLLREIWQITQHRSVHFLPLASVRATRAAERAEAVLTTALIGKCSDHVLAAVKNGDA